MSLGSLKDAVYKSLKELSPTETYINTSPVSDYITQVAQGNISGSAYKEFNKTILDADRANNNHVLISYTVPVLKKALIIKVEGDIGPKSGATASKQGKFIFKTNSITLFETSVFSRGTMLNKDLYGKMLVANDTLELSFYTEGNNTQVNSRVVLIEVDL